MKTTRKILDCQNKIVSLLQPGKYTKLDDISMYCNAGRYGTKSGTAVFVHAYKDLIACGRLAVCGNEVKLKQ